MYKDFKVTNRPGCGCIKAPKTMTVVRTTPGLNAFVLDIPGNPREPLLNSRFYFLDTDREEFYRKVSWSQLMNKEEAEFRDHQWNHVALRALLLVLAATHRKEFSEFTLDLQNDRWWHDSAPLDAEPCGPYVPRVTDAPRRSASSSSSSAPSAVSGLNRSSESHALRPPRALFRTSRLSEEEPPQSCAVRPGCRSMPHHIVDGDYATMGDGTLVELQALMRNHRQWGWGLEYDLKEPKHFMEDDHGLPLEPAFPISPMVQEEPVTPVYLD